MRDPQFTPPCSLTCSGGTAAGGRTRAAWTAGLDLGALALERRQCRRSSAIAIAFDMCGRSSRAVWWCEIAGAAHTLSRQPTLGNPSMQPRRDRMRARNATCGPRCNSGPCPRSPLCEAPPPSDPCDTKQEAPRSLCACCACAPLAQQHPCGRVLCGRAPSLAERRARSARSLARPPVATAASSIDRSRGELALA